MSTSAQAKAYHRHRGADAGTRRARTVATRWRGGLLLLWLLTSVYIVRTDQQAVVTRFGAVVEPRVMPGIHVALPWPIDRVTKLKVQQLQRLVVGGELPDTCYGPRATLQSQFLTGDQNIISMRVVVQYSVGVPVDYLFRTENVARSVGAAVETALAERIADAQRGCRAHHGKAEHSR